jgi:hypothetical protein
MTSLGVGCHPNFFLYHSESVGKVPTFSVGRSMPVGREKPSRVPSWASWFSPSQIPSW